jgi:hypothetical protein
MLARRSDAVHSALGLNPKEDARHVALLRCACPVVYALLAFAAFSWVVVLFPLPGVSDAPAFARSLIWSSLAHQSDEYDRWKARNALPPPPPHFH